jgi:hypothetical protein
MRGVAHAVTYYDEPPWHIVSGFKTFIRKTGKPEDFPGLHQGPLPKDAPFRILTSFDVDRKKRSDGQMAFCPMCMSTDKFLHGGCLVWFVDGGYVAAIGPECADKENMRLAKAAYGRKVQAEREENYLIERLPLVQKRLQVLESILPAFEEADRVHRVVKGKASRAKAQLSSVFKQGGVLAIEEEIEPSLRGIGPSGLTKGDQLRTVNYGSLRGETMKLNKLELSKKLSRVISTLKHYRHWWTEERALAEVIDCDESWRHETYEYLRDAEEKYKQLRNSLIDFRRFFLHDNIERIAAWTQHPAHPAPFRISLVNQQDPEGWLLEIKGPDKNHAKVLIKTMMLDRALPSELLPV